MANTITNVSTNAPRGAAYIASGDWWPHQEIFPLPPQEGKPMRPGPNLDETCSGGPGGFSLEQINPYWWNRPGPDLGGEVPVQHTGHPDVQIPTTVVLMSYPPDTTVRDILKTKKSSIRQAPLEPGSPSWDDILDDTWREVEQKARQRLPGYQTIRKLLTDKRFKR